MSSNQDHATVKGDQSPTNEQKPTGDQSPPPVAQPKSQSEAKAVSSKEENKDGKVADEEKKKEEHKQIGNFSVGKFLAFVDLENLNFLGGCWLWIHLGKTKGKGTFGKVKQGTHEPTGEKVSCACDQLPSVNYSQVAIKILEKEKIKDHADLERINREITILKKVRHPNVV